MKILTLLLLSVTLLVGADNPASRSAESELPTQAIGTYVGFSTTIGLQADGTYWMSHWGEFRRWSVEIGAWKWNVRRKEFQLSRTLGELAISINRLRIDDRNEGRLLWIPDLLGLGEAEGAIDYVGFVKRPEE